MVLYHYHSRDWLIYAFNPDPLILDAVDEKFNGEWLKVPTPRVPNKQ
jgi:hypothetical protein